MVAKATRCQQRFKQNSSSQTILLFFIHFSLTHSVIKKYIKILYKTHLWLMSCIKSFIIVTLPVKITFCCQVYTMPCYLEFLSDVKCIPGFIIIKHFLSKCHFPSKWILRANVLKVTQRSQRILFQVEFYTVWLLLVCFEIFEIMWNMLNLTFVFFSRKAFNFLPPQSKMYLMCLCWINYFPRVNQYQYKSEAPKYLLNSRG